MNIATNQHVFIHINDIWFTRMGVFRIIESNGVWRIILNQFMDEFTKSFNSLYVIQKIELLYSSCKPPTFGEAHFGVFLDCHRRRYWIPHPVPGADPHEIQILSEWAEYETTHGSLDVTQIKL